MALDRREEAKRQATKWFFVLLTAGLVLGGVVAFGVVQLIDKFGLANKPNHPLRIEPYQQPSPPQN